MLYCDKEGRVQTLLKSMGLVDQWLKQVKTHETLRRRLVKFAKRRGSVRMENIVWGEGRKFGIIGASVDVIGWRRFMEGMVSTEVLVIQQKCVEVGGCQLSLGGWARGLVVKLLEVTHEQWLYRNIAVRDLVGGVKAIKRKQDRQKEIERQIELGGEGLAKQDHYLLEINLEDLEIPQGRISTTGY